jgi:hypothetical protein
MKDLPENPQKNYEPTLYAGSQLRPLYSPKSSCRISAHADFHSRLAGLTVFSQRDSLKKHELAKGT